MRWLRIIARHSANTWQRPAGSLPSPGPRHWLRESGVQQTSPATSPNPIGCFALNSLEARGWHFGCPTGSAGYSDEEFYPAYWPGKGFLLMPALRKGPGLATT